MDASVCDRLVSGHKQHHLRSAALVCRGKAFRGIIEGCYQCTTHICTIVDLNAKMPQNWQKLYKCIK